MKTFKFGILTLLLVYVLIELSSCGGLIVQDKFRDMRYAPADTLSRRHARMVREFIDDESEYVAFSPELGWSIKDNGVSRTYQANSRGIRGDKEYAREPAAGVRRITTFGDSFTHCDDVRNHETWQAVMESRDPGLEVINFGVGGFGLDQAYLRYLEEGQEYRSDMVFIGYMSLNISRNVNTYRPFYRYETGIPLVKPRFILEHGKLSLVPNVMRVLDDYGRLLRHPEEVISELSEHDYYYARRYRSSPLDWSPTYRFLKVFKEKDYRDSLDEEIFVNREYNEDSEAFQVTAKIFDAFHEAAMRNRSTPVILVFPTRGDIVRYQRDRTATYAPLLAYFDSRGYRYIDMAGAFEEEKVEDLFKGHYSPHANRLVAGRILDYLANMEAER